MNTIRFMKYDLRRSKYLLLLSVVLFAPLSALMGFSHESVSVCFTYMGLVAIVVPTSLFTYEQKVDCGFDSMLPAKEMDKVCGRYLVSCVFIAYELIIGFIVAGIVSWRTDMEVSRVGMIVKIFIAALLFYLSFALPLYYMIGRNLNQQIRGVVIILPGLGIWALANIVFSVMTLEENTNELLSKIIENGEMISLIAMVVAIVLFALSAALSTLIIRKKDYR